MNTGCGKRSLSLIESRSTSQLAHSFTVVIFINYILTIHLAYICGTQPNCTSVASEAFQDCASWRLKAILPWHTKPKYRLGTMICLTVWQSRRTKIGAPYIHYNKNIAVKAKACRTSNLLSNNMWGVTINWNKQMDLYNFAFKRKCRKTLLCQYRSILSTLSLH